MKQFLGLVILVLLWGNPYAQCTIIGQITDENGDPLAGANVVVTKTRQGAATDVDGRYQIENVRPGEHMLKISYVGYESIFRKTLIKPKVERLVLHAQLKERFVEVNELVVKATRANNRTPVTYTNLNKEVIEQNNLGQDVPYLLRWTPSAVVTSDAGTGIGYTGIRIRGTDPTRINVTINGIPLNDAESQGVFWVDLPDFVSSTNDIQIQRGVGTSTNGTGAFGATINLNTSQIYDKAYAKINGTFGSFNTRKVNVQFGSGLLNEKFSLDGRLSRITSDGYIDRATADLDSYYLSGAFIGDKTTLRFNVFSGHEITYQAWNGVPADFVNDPELRTFNSAGMEKPGEPHDNEVDDYRQTHYQLLFNNQLSRNWNLNLALHYTRGKGFFELYQAEESLIDFNLEPVKIGEEVVEATDLIERRWLDNDFYGTTYALNYLSNDNRIEATLGGGYSVYKGQHFGEVIWAEFFSNGEPGHRYYDNDAEKLDFNIYGKINYEILYGLYAYLDLQYRRVNYDFLGFNDDLQNVQQSDQLNFFNPKLGVLFKANEKIDLYASFGIANREPNRNDYTENPAGVRPRPERLYNLELGYRQQWKKARVGANLYYMAYKDQLALNGQINDVGEYSRINIDNSYRLGLELEGGAEITEGLHLTANVTLSRNKVDRFVEFVDVYDANFDWLRQDEIVREDTDLSFSPSIIGGVAVSYEWSGLELALLSKYVSKQYIDNSSDENNTIDPYFFNDFRLQYQFKTSFIKEIGLTFLARNIFNAKFETNAWSYRFVQDGSTLIDQGFYPQAGTNFLVGISLGF